MKAKVSSLSAIICLITLLFFCVLACDNGSSPDNVISKSNGLANVCLRVNDKSSGVSQKSISVESDWSNLTFKYMAKPEWSGTNIQGAVTDWADLDYSDGMSLGYFTPGQWVFHIQMLNNGTAVYEGHSEVITISTSDVDVTVPVSKIPSGSQGTVDIEITAPAIAADDVLTISWGGGSASADKSTNGGITTYTYHANFDIGSYIFTLTHNNVDRGTAFAIELHQCEVVKVRGLLDNGEWKVGSITMLVRNITVERYNWKDINHPWDAAPSPKYCGTVDIDIDSAVEGDMVSFTANPATGSSVLSASATWSGGNIDLEYELNNHLYSFIMPDGDVNIRVKFAEVDPVPVDTLLFRTIVQSLYAENNGNVRVFGKASNSPGMGVRSIALGDVQLWYDSSEQKICWYSNADVVQLGAGSLIELFKDCITYEIISMEDIVTTAVTNMAGMFQGCTGLTSLSLGNFDASSATDISNMFQGCVNLPSIAATAFSTNTTSSVNMAGLFKDFSSLSKIKDSNNNLASLGFNASKATSLAGVFQGCSSLAKLNLGSFDAGSATDISNMFQGCTSLASLTATTFNTNTSTSVNMAGLFKDCSSLNKINNSNNIVLPSGFNASKATNLAGMFQGCSSLQKLNLSSFNAGSATDLSNMFHGCTNLNTLTLTSFTTNSTTPVKMKEMFRDCSKLNSLNLSSFNTSTATDMAGMFRGCLKLNGALDISNFNTANVTDMSYMFCACRALTSINFGGNFDTSKVTDMAYMFSSNETSIESPPAMSLTSLDVSGFDTSKVGTGTDPGNPGSLRNMFYMCYKLTSLDVSGFRTPYVQDMSYMFACYLNKPSGLSALDLREWDFTNVKTVRNMFDRCELLNTYLLFPGEKDPDDPSAPVDESKKTNFASLTNMSFLFSQCLALTPDKFRSIVSTWTFAANPNNVYEEVSTSLFGNTDSNRDKGGNYIFRDTMTKTGAKFETRTGYTTRDGETLYIGGGNTVRHGRLTVFNTLP